MKTLLAAVSCSMLLAGCAGMMQKEGPSAFASLRPLKDSQAHGEVTFTQKGNKVLVKAEVGALTPGLHGFHLHEKGDCSASDGMSAGAHFNPHKKRHGGPQDAERHGGDLGNLKANEYGKATLTLEVDGISLGTGPDNIIGKGVIVHAGPDDLKTDPTGNSGGRVACGVISLK